jgi:hypothetical protein
MTYMQGNNWCSWTGVYGFVCSADGYGNWPSWCDDTKSGYADCSWYAGGYGLCRATNNFYLDTVNPSGQSQSTVAIEQDVKVGQIGDAISVYVSNLNNPVYKPYAIRAAMPATRTIVLDAMVGFGNNNEISIAGEASLTIDSWPSDGFPLKSQLDVTSLTTMGLLQSDIVRWDKTPPTCGTMWSTETGC